MEDSGKITSSYTLAFTVSRSLSPLRFIERDGKRILQHPIQCLNTHAVKWEDVPFVENPEED